MNKFQLDLFDQEIDGTNIQVSKIGGNSYVVILNTLVPTDSYGHELVMNSEAVVLSEKEMKKLKNLLKELE
jgi:hypothetical protein